MTKGSTVWAMWATLSIAVASLAPSLAAPDVEFQSAFPVGVERVWIGPDYFANRLQDWRVSQGRVECVEGSRAKPMRTLHLVTHRLDPEPGTVLATVRTGPLAEGADPNPNTWTGFLLGAGGPGVDPRLSALCHHWPGEQGGIVVGVDGTGAVVFRDNGHGVGPRGPRPNLPLETWPELGGIERESVEGAALDDLVLVLEARPEGELYRVELTARDFGSGEVVARGSVSDVHPSAVDGNLALVSHYSRAEDGAGYWFRDLHVSGSKLREHADDAFGPVMCALHTLSRGTLKLTAQMGPLGAGDTPTARLELLRGEDWEVADTAEVDPSSATAHFRVDGWDATQAVPYRVAYDLVVGDGETRTHHYAGTIRAEPNGDEPLELAAFSCHHISAKGGQHWTPDHFWFPHPELVEHVTWHDPDLAFFAGDQIYEGGLAGIVRAPTDTAILDYLYHWYDWCWAFRDVVRDVPAVVIPDDHDVYHGNIWGNAGVRAPRGEAFRRDSDRGGYMMDTAFVNAVHRTQCGHLPDPVDPEPLANGISVYFTAMNYGGVSFAILADRMWKSAPTAVIPEGEVFNGWFHAEGFDPATQSDVEGAVLLGERQLEFLEAWSADWSHGAQLKVVLSQTIFANVATLPAEAENDGAVPGLSYAEPGEYVEGDVLAADCDSNGWPQSGRDAALRAMRRGFAFHVAGDQHLPSFTHYGVDAHGDAANAFCVPAIANVWPRRFFPPTPGENREPGAPAYTGDMRDGFGNLVRVRAVANPRRSGVRPTALNDRMPGYGIVELDTRERVIVSHCWPRWVDPSTATDADQFEGWPIRVTQADNYGREVGASLPMLYLSDPGLRVVTVIDERTDEWLYTLRAPGELFRPWGFDPDSTYTVVVTDPDAGEERRYTGLVPVGIDFGPIDVK